MFRVDVTSLRTEIAMKLNKIKDLELDVQMGDRDASEDIVFLRMDIQCAEQELMELVG